MVAKRRTKAQVAIDAKSDAIFESLFKAVEKDYGKGSLFDMSKRNIVRAPTFSYGSLRLDLATGGCPRGRVIEVFGPESSGKTTLMLCLVASAQRDSLYLAEGRRAMYVDAEHALDINYAASGPGVDVKRLLITQPDNGEQAFDILSAAIKTGKISIAVVDSVSSLVPQKELEGDIGDSHVGLQARMMSQAMRMLVGLCNRTGTTLAFINQIRYKIGVTFGSPETTSGGNALKFAASQRLDIRRIGSIKATAGEDAGEAIANRVRVKVIKNKIAPPFREAELDIRFGMGIDLVAEAVDMAVDRDIIIKSGAWYSLPSGERLAQGRENAVAALRGNPELLERVRACILSALLPQNDSIETDNQGVVEES